MQAMISLVCWAESRTYRVHIGKVADSEPNEAVELQAECRNEQVVSKLFANGGSEHAQNPDTVRPKDHTGIVWEWDH